MRQLGLTILLEIVLIFPAPAQTPPAALFDQLRPHLEAVLGQRLDAAPRLRPASMDEALRVPDLELALQLGWQFPDLRGSNTLDRGLYAAKQADRLTRVAVPDRKTGDILWLPEQARQVAHWNAALARVDSPAFLQLALVQAIVQAHLDRTYDLPRKWMQCRDEEAFRIWQTLRAGRALSVTRQVARRLGTEALVPLLWQSYRHVPDANGDNAQRLICREALQRRMTASMEGLAFFDFLEEQHWPDLEKRVFTRPPTQFGWIARPAHYVKALTTNRPSLDAVLGELQGSLPASEWQAIQQPWTPDMVRQAATLLGQKTEAEKVLRAWEEARTLLWVNRRQEKQQIAVSVVRFENETGARAYYGFANDLQRKRDELKDAPCAGMLRVLDSHFSALQLRPADEAVRCDKQLQLDPKSPPLSEKKILARAGEVVVEIAWYGLEADPAWAERLLAGLVR